MWSHIWRKRKAAFVSYPSVHFEHVEIIVDLLSTVSNIYMDKRSLRFGENWEKGIGRAIRRSDKFFLVWCVHSANSTEVQKELDIAIENDIPVLPVLFDEHPLPSVIQQIHAVTRTRGVCQGISSEDLSKERINNLFQRNIGLGLTDDKRDFDFEVLLQTGDHERVKSDAERFLATKALEIFAELQN